MHSGITALGISQCYIGSFMHSGITALGISQCYIGSFMHHGITASLLPVYKISCTHISS